MRRTETEDREGKNKRAGLEVALIFGRKGGFSL